MEEFELRVSSSSSHLRVFNTVWKLVADNIAKYRYMCALYWCCFFACTVSLENSLVCCHWHCYSCCALITIQVVTNS